MISFHRAQRLIEKNLPPLQKRNAPLLKALGCVIAEDIRSPFDLPTRDHSAMDGFVLKAQDAQAASSYQPVHLKIQGTIKAGDHFSGVLGPREVYRIMTGAMIPEGGDAVVPKEKAKIEKDDLVLVEPVVRGNHIRRRGEEVRRGEVLLKRHLIVQPAAIGILASIGRKSVKIFRKPKISLIATGSELIQPGHPMKPGKIYDSNSWMTASALRGMGMSPCFVRTVGDRPQRLRETLRIALKKSDILILTGGVSVGDYDCVKGILKTFGVRTIFWKVRQKPGKPLFFGKKRDVLVFGLPGNPASVYTCFYEYVYPALRAAAGFSKPFLKERRTTLLGGVGADPEKILFLKGKCGEDKQGKWVVTPLARQASHMISSLGEANCLIRIPPQAEAIAKGAGVLVDMLPSEEVMVR